MQFRLNHLLAAVTVLCVFMGLIFVSPPIVGMPVILFLLTLWPGIWVVGVAFAQGRRRAFFLSGLTCGLVPCLFAYYHFVYSLEVYVDGVRYGSVFPELWLPAYAEGWWWSNLILALPWLTGILGGIAALATFRLAIGNGDLKN